LIEILPLLAAAALVGVLHMSAPDHWVTLCVLAQASKWSKGRLVGFGVATAAGHVLLSVILGFVLVGLGLLFSQTLSSDITLVIGVVMLFGGLAFGFKTILSREKDYYRYEASQQMPRLEKQGRGITYFAVLGAALSPDLSILPIFLLAVPVGITLAVDTAVVFAAASISSLVLLVLLGSMGFARVFSRTPAKYNDGLVGFVVAAVGAYILVFG
jgi:nickel/cobalt exporter